MASTSGTPRPAAAKGTRRARRRAKPLRPAALAQRRGRHPPTRSRRAEASEEARARPPRPARASPLHLVSLLAGGHPNAASRPIHLRSSLRQVRAPEGEETLSDLTALPGAGNESLSSTDR